MSPCKHCLEALSPGGEYLRSLPTHIVSREAISGGLYHQGGHPIDIGGSGMINVVPFVMVTPLRWCRRIRAIPFSLLGVFGGCRAFP